MGQKAEDQAFTSIGLIDCDRFADKRDETSNEELMQSISGGDTVAFQTLYDRFSDIVYSTCVRKLKHELEANEVVSSIFFEIWQKADRFDPCRGTAAAYLFMLTRSRIIDYVRNKVRRKRMERFLGSFVELNNLESISIEPHDYIVAIETCMDLQNAMAELSDVQLSLVKASFFNGLSHRQIAMLFKLPLGTVKTSIRRAIIGMRAVCRRIDREREAARGSQETAQPA